MGRDARSVAVAVVLGVVLGAATATPARADAVDDGIRKYDDGDYEDAVAALTEAAASPLPDARRAQALLFAGLTHYLLGREDLARDAFARALWLDPLVRPRDTERPVLATLFADVHRRVVGRLEVRCDDTAAVEIDHAPAGTTPLIVERPVGRHHVRVRSPDARREHVREDLLLRAGDVARVDAVLVPRNGVVAVRSRPAGAVVVEGTHRHGTTPLDRLVLTAGPHRLRLRLPDHDDLALDVDVDPDHPAGHDVELIARRRVAWATWVAAGLGVALTAGGIGAGAAAREAESAIADDVRADDRIESSRHRRLSGLAHDRALAANVLLGAGAAAALTAGVLLFFDLWDGASRRDDP